MEDDLAFKGQCNWIKKEQVIKPGITANSILIETPHKYGNISMDASTWFH